MPLTEAMLNTRYSPSDERVLAKLQGFQLPVNRAQAEINRLTEQLHHAVRINCILEEQVKSAQAEAKKYRGRYDDLVERLKREQLKREQLKQAALKRAAPQIAPAREPRSYAERMRLKRF